MPLCCVCQRDDLLEDAFSKAELEKSVDHRTCNACAAASDVAVSDTGESTATAVPIVPSSPTPPGRQVLENSEAKEPPVDEVKKDSPANNSVPPVASPSGSNHSRMNMFQMFTRRILSPLSDPKPETKVDLEAEKKRQMDMLREQLQQMDAGLVETLDTQQKMQEQLVEQARSESQEHGLVQVDPSDSLLKQDFEQTELDLAQENNVNDPDHEESMQDREGLPVESSLDQKITTTEPIDFPSESVASALLAESSPTIQGNDESNVVSMNEDPSPDTESAQQASHQASLETGSAPLAETIDAKKNEDVDGELCTTNEKEKPTPDESSAENVHETLGSIPTTAETEKSVAVMDTNESQDIAATPSTGEVQQPVSDDVLVAKQDERLGDVPTSTQTEASIQATDIKESTEISTAENAPTSNEILPDVVEETPDSVASTTEPGSLVEAIDLQENTEIASEANLPVSNASPGDNVDETIDSLPTNTEPEASVTIIDTNLNLENESTISTGEVQLPGSDDVVAENGVESLSGVPTIAEPEALINESTEITSDGQGPVSHESPSDKVDETLDDLPTRTETDPLLQAADLKESAEITSEESGPASDEIPADNVEENLDDFPTSAEREASIQAIDIKDSTEISSAQNAQMSEEIPRDNVDETLDSVPSTTEQGILVEAIDLQKNTEIASEANMPVSHEILAEHVDEALDGFPTSTETEASIQASDIKESTEISSAENAPMSHEVPPDNVKETLDNVPTTTEPGILVEAIDLKENTEIASEENMPVYDEIPSNNGDETLDRVVRTTEPEALVTTIDKNLNLENESTLSTGEVQLHDVIAENGDESLDVVPTNVEPEALIQAIAGKESTENASDEHGPVSDELLAANFEESDPTTSDSGTLVELLDKAQDSEIASETKAPHSDDIPAGSVDETPASAPTIVEPEALTTVTDTGIATGNASSTDKMQQPSSDDVALDNGDKADESLDVVVTSMKPEVSTQADDMNETTEISSDEQAPVCDIVSTGTVDQTLESLPTNTEPDTLAKVIDTNQGIGIASILQAGELRLPPSDVIIDNDDGNLDFVPASKQPEPMDEAIDLKDSTEIASDHPAAGEENAPLSEETPIDNVDETHDSVPTNAESGTSTQDIDEVENPEIAKDEKALVSDEIPAANINETLDGIPTNTEAEASAQVTDTDERIVTASALPTDEVQQPASDDNIADKVDGNQDVVPASKEPESSVEAIDLKESTEIASEHPAAGEENAPLSEEAPINNVHENDVSVPTTAESGTLTQDIDMVENSEVAKDDEIPAANIDETLDRVPTNAEAQAEASTQVTDTIEGVVTANALPTDEVQQPASDDIIADKVDSVPTNAESGTSIQDIDMVENPEVENEETALVAYEIPAVNIDETLDSVPKNAGAEASAQVTDTNEGVVTASALPTDEVQQPAFDDNIANKVDGNQDVIPTSAEPEPSFKAIDLKESTEIASEHPAAGEENTPLSEETPVYNVDETPDSVPTNTESGTSIQDIDMVENPEVENEETALVAGEIPAVNIDETLDSVPRNAEADAEASAQVTDTNEGVVTASALPKDEVQEPASDDIIADKIDGNRVVIPTSAEPEPSFKAIDLKESTEIASEHPATREEIAPLSEKTQIDSVDETPDGVPTNTESGTLIQDIDRVKNRNVAKDDEIPAANVDETLHGVPINTEAEASAKVNDTNEGIATASELPTDEVQLPASDGVVMDKVDGHLDAVPVEPGPEVLINAIDTKESTVITNDNQEHVPMYDVIQEANLDEALQIAPTNAQALADIHDTPENNEVGSALPCDERLLPASDDILTRKVDENPGGAPTSSDETAFAVDVKDRTEITSDHAASEENALVSDEILAQVADGADQPPQSVPTTTEPESQAVDLVESPKGADNVAETLDNVPTNTEPDNVEQTDIPANEGIPAVANLETIEAMSTSEEPVHVTRSFEAATIQEMPEVQLAIVSDGETQGHLDVTSDALTNDVVPKVELSDKEEPQDTSNDKVQAARAGEGGDTMLAHIHPLETLKKLSDLVLPTPIPPRQESMETQKRRQSALIREKLKELDLEELEIEIEQQQQTQTQLVQQAMESSMSRVVLDTEDNDENGGPRERETSTHNRSSRVLGQVTDWLSGSLHYHDDGKTGSASRGGKVDAGDHSKDLEHRAKHHGFLSAVGGFLSGSSHHRDTATPPPTADRGSSATGTKESGADAPTLKDRLQVLINECDDNQELRERILELIQADAKSATKTSKTVIGSTIPMSPLDLTIPKNTGALREALNRSRASRDYSAIRKQYWSIHDHVEPKAAARAARRARTMEKLQRLDALIEEAQKQTWIEA